MKYRFNSDDGYSFNIFIFFMGVVELVNTLDLGSKIWEFDSPHPYYFLSEYNINGSVSVLGIESIGSSPIIPTWPLIQGNLGY